ncbi:MAG TPA: metallopeptidase family protein, partial [Bryobacteraceae bacterium]|nr:metallopeptidase family protein [Bryobacteraceae bacterium]
MWMRMSPAEFDRLVEKALRAIPPRFRRRLKNVAFIVEPEPPSPNLLGLYQGRPLPYRSVSDGFTLPDRITIYQGPHERLARNRSRHHVLGLQLGSGARGELEAEVGQALEPRAGGAALLGARVGGHGGHGESRPVGRPRSRPPQVDGVAVDAPLDPDLLEAVP